MLATFGVAGIFAFIFYVESWWNPDFGRESKRRLVSFSVGAAVTYVFIHLLPELAAASERFVELDERRALPFPHLRVYGAALAGFMLFYGLEHMVRWVHVSSETAEQREEAIHLRILTASYALYVFAVCYAMAHEARIGSGELALYALAMGLHFFGFAHGLQRDSRGAYERFGRHVLAAAALFGWAVALLPIPESVAYTMLGFAAGVLIMNTVTSELAGLAEGRFFPFLAGGVAYAFLLLLLDS